MKLKRHYQQRHDKVKAAYMDMDRMSKGHLNVDESDDADWMDLIGNDTDSDASREWVVEDTIAVCTSGAKRAKVVTRPGDEVRYRTPRNRHLRPLLPNPMSSSSSEDRRNNVSISEQETVEEGNTTQKQPRRLRGMVDYIREANQRL
jgi:hypothetical protein